MNPGGGGGGRRRHRVGLPRPALVLQRLVRLERVHLAAACRPLAHAAARHLGTVRDRLLRRRTLEARAVEAQRAAPAAAAPLAERPGGCRVGRRVLFARGAAARAAAVGAPAVHARRRRGSVSERGRRRGRGITGS